MRFTFLTLFGAAVLAGCGAAAAPSSSPTNGQRRLDRSDRFDG